VRLLNKGAARSFAIAVAGLTGATVRSPGVTPGADDRLVVDIGQDQTRELRVSLQVPAAAIPDGEVNIEIMITDTETGRTATARDHFVPPTR
jgi:hypothetical protein